MTVPPTHFLNKTSLAVCRRCLREKVLGYDALTAWGPGECDLFGRSAATVFLIVSYRLKGR